MDITKELIPLIENALGIELHEHQIDYLLGNGDLKLGRKTGKTIAYCVKLSLTEGKPLDLNYPEKFADEILLGNHVSYARTFFKYEFMKIREALKNHGFTVREVTY